MDPREEVVVVVVGGGGGLQPPCHVGKGNLLECTGICVTQHINSM